MFRKVLFRQYPDDECAGYLAWLTGRFVSSAQFAGALTVGVDQPWYRRSLELTAQQERVTAMAQFIQQFTQRDEGYWGVLLMTAVWVSGIDPEAERQEWWPSFRELALQIGEYFLQGYLSSHELTLRLLRAASPPPDCAFMAALQAPQHPRTKKYARWLVGRFLTDRRYIVSVLGRDAPLDAAQNAILGEAQRRHMRRADLAIENFARDETLCAPLLLYAVWLPGLDAEAEAQPWWRSFAHTAVEIGTVYNMGDFSPLDVTMQLYYAAECARRLTAEAVAMEVIPSP